MLGAIARATGCVKLESLSEPIKHSLPGKVGDLNIVAAKKGWDAMKILEAKV
jgi:Pyruvate/2-oxoacid:ferredoxin oxidoreductase gamma subunit